MKTNLGKICDIDWGNTSLTKKSYVENGKYLAVSAKGCDGRINHYEHDEDVCILSAIGAQCGKMFFPQEKFTAIKNTITLKPKKDLVDSKFLYYLFTSIKLPKRGAAQPFMSKGDIEKFEIDNFPDVNEQQRIVTKIDKVFAETDKAITIKKSSKEKIEKLKNSILDNLLNNNFLNIKIGDICELIYGKGLPKEKRVNENGIPAYGANGIKCYTTEPLYNRPSIIIGRKGSAGELQWVDNPFWALDVTYYVLPNEKKVNLKFLYYLLQMQNLPKLAKGVKPGINRNDVYNINVKLPPIDEQIKITDKLEKIFKHQQNLKELVDKIIANYNSLKLAIISKEMKN